MLVPLADALNITAITFLKKQVTKRCVMTGTDALTEHLKAAWIRPKAAWVYASAVHCKLMATLGRL